MKHFTCTLALALTLLVTAAVSNTLPGASAPDRFRTQTGPVAGTVQLTPMATRTLLDHTSLLPAPAKLTSDKHAGLISTGIRFQENRGQIIDVRGKVRPEIAFVANTPGAKLYFRNDGISTVFTNTVRKQKIDLPVEIVAPQNRREEMETQYYRLDMKLVGSNPFARVRAHDELPGYINFYLGHCPNGITGVREFSRIVYEHVYDNIDLEILSIDGKMKYNFIVRSGGNVSDIRMKYAGALETAITVEGSLHIATPLGHIEEATPCTYAGDASKHIPSRFVRDGNTVSFEVGAYDPTQTLVIDPWATYYGGTYDDVASCVRTDVAGNVVVSGLTMSGDFPITVGAFQTANGGSRDAFLAKFDAFGSRLWATYYGGSGSEGHGLIYPQAAIDGDGNTSIAGCTTSSDLPVSVGAFQTSYGGNTDAFVAKFSPTGSLQWATYYGGSGEEFSDVAVGVDGSGRVLLTGGTKSTNFPVSPGAYQASHAPGPNGFDVFVVVLLSDGSRAWATYYGDRKGELGCAIQADGNGNIFVSGYAAADFPVSPGAYQTANAGGNDAFIVKFTGGGARLWATYYGGSQSEHLRSIAVDGSGEVIIGGYTMSSDLPSTGGGFQPSSGGGTDGFLVKFTGAGALNWASYCGGSGTDYINGIATDANANILLAGSTVSTNFPVTGGAFQTMIAGSDDGFSAKINAGGVMQWATFIGGSGSDRAHNITADVSGNVFVSGRTASTNFPTLNPHQSALAGEGDAFVLSLNSSGAMPGYNVPPVAVASATPIQGTAPLAVSFSSAGSYDPDGTITGYHWDFGDNNTSTSADPSHTYTNAGVYSAVLSVTDNNSATGTVTVPITVNSANSYVYVFDQTVTRIQTSSNKWKGSDVVTIYDGLDQPVSGAVVTASYSGPNSGTVTGTTGANGTVILQTSQKTNPSGTWCFTVTNVQATGFTFNASIGEVTSCEGTPKVSVTYPTSIDVNVFPNPFNPTTTITYEIPKDGYVLLRVFDVHGHVVTELVNEEMQVGTYTVEFNGSNLPSGIYLYRLEAGGQVRDGRMMLMK